MLPHNLNRVKGRPPACITGGKLTTHARKRRELPFEQLNVLQFQKQRLAIGWIAGTFPEENWDEVKKLLEQTFGTGFSRARTGRNFYDECWVSSLSGGLFMCRNVYFDEETEKSSPPPTEHGRAYFSVSAGLIESLVPRWFFFFLGQLGGVGFRPTRIDISYDDFDRLIPIEAFWAFKTSGCITRFRNGKPHIQHVEGKGVSYQGVVLGGRGKDGGGFHIRYYDKNIESKGKINAIRLEAEITGEKVKAVWNEICNHLPDDSLSNLEQIESEFCRKIAAILGSIFDIVWKSKSGHLSRSKRIGLWQEFLDGLTDSLVRIANHKRRSNLDRTRSFFIKQWGPMLAVFRAVSFGSSVSGRSTFHDLIEFAVRDGEARLTDKHIAMITANEGML
jgi:hypothetical protein